LPLGGFNESHWQSYLILDPGFQSSLFQSFGPASRMLDVSESHSRCIYEYPVSSIRHRSGRIDCVTPTAHEAL